jgi:hypothetical protein
MGANQEIGKGRRSRSSTTTIFHEALSRQEGRLAGNRSQSYETLRKSRLKVLDSLESNGDFR